MEELKTRFPEGVDYEIGYDTTPFIRESVNEVFNTLRNAVILVTIVVLLFLQDWRAMILPMINVPVSLIGTFAVMAAMGYSLNNISLFGLVLAIGIVVDDAIVVLENIERQMAKGLDVRAATIQAMAEITGPVIAITLVLCTVFVPCAFMSGITGRFFRQFAVTISASTIISAVNALTMTPSRALLIFRSNERNGPHSRQPEALPWWIFGLFGGLAAVWLGSRFLAGPASAAIGGLAAPEGASAHPWQLWLFKTICFTPGLLAGLALGWFVARPVNALLRLLFRGFNYLFEQLTAAYGWSVGRLLRLAAAALAVYAGLLALTYGAAHRAPTGFVPQQDQGRVFVGIQLPDSASLQRTEQVVKQIKEITRRTPGVADTIAICGMSFVQQATGSNFASLFVVLDPFAKRRSPDRSDEAIMAVLRKEWRQQVKGAQVIVFGPRRSRA